MQTILRTSKNLELTEPEFVELIDKLKRGDEQLFEKIFLGFFEKNLKLLKAKYQAEHENAYDCVMWAMLRMRQMLLEDKISYGNLDNYFSRIAVTRYVKQQSRKREFAVEELPELGIGEDHFIDDATLIRLNKAWDRLDEPCQKLLKGFYYDKIELKELSVLLDDTSAANTRKRKERCLKKLREFFFEERD
ncbi:MAG: sigma-70 family RNA polymerase sigma factor [Phaeodactylibacter sp.]|nr:sigma-70 family RNA polymerase sigma factor [Phaeodactylibacter sp.]